jgi:hypothetical protein
LIWRRTNSDSLLIGHAFLSTPGNPHGQDDKPRRQEDGHHDVARGRKGQRKNGNAPQDDVAAVFLFVGTDFIDDLATLDIHQDHRKTHHKLIGLD